MKQVFEATMRAASPAEARAVWREFAEARAAYWKLAEEVATRTGLVSEAAHCALRHWEFRELLDLIDALEKAAA